MSHLVASDLQSDRQLVYDARAGDRDAFSKLVTRYERPVMAVTLNILHHWPDASDAAQDAFLQAYRNLNRLQSPDRFGPWIFKIARRIALRLRKSRSKMPQSTVTTDVPDGRPALPKVSTEMLSLFDRLPEAERHLILLRHIDGMTTPEIASITGRPIGTVTKQLSRAHQRLRGWLAGERE